jgi:hypothetical protein
VSARPAEDPLAEIAARLEAAQAAAERLAAQAAAARLAADPAHPPAPGDATAELHALLGLLDTARALVPEELWARLVELCRALLVALRALLDGWIARLEPGAPAQPAAPVVQDVPVDP